MKLLKELVEASGFSSLLVLTYGADLAWFEAVLSRQLRARGVHRFVVLADPVQLSETLEEQAAYLTGPGRAYSLHGVPVDGAFHPKAYLLTGKTGARLYVGSGNLTTTGLNGNLEIFERWDADDSSVRIPRAFTAFKEYVDKILRERLTPLPLHLRDALSALFDVRSLGKPSEPKGTELAGAPGALWARLATPPTPATRMTMLAPYFDTGGTAAVALARRLSAASFDVWTDRDSTNLTPAAIDAIVAAGGSISFLEDEPRVHAKMLYAEGAGWSLSCTGSANLSQAAWSGRNAELIALRKDAAAREVMALLDQKSVTPLNSTDRDKLERREESRLAQGTGTAVSREPALAILNARRDELGESVLLETLRGNLPELPRSAEIVGHPTPLELTVIEETVIAEASPTRSLRFQLPVSVAQARRPLIIRLTRGDEEGPWAVVHDRQELRLQSEASSDDSVRRDMLLDAVITNPTNAEQLMEFLVDVHTRRASREREEAAERAVAPPTTGLQDPGSWVWVSNDEFKQAIQPERDELRGPHTGETATRILKQLLFGGTEEEADVDEGESDDTGDEPISRSREPDADDVVDQHRQASFFELAESARTAYLVGLAQGNKKGVVRLVEDLEVLSVTLAAALRAGLLEPHRFVVQQVRMLREFLGSDHSPVARALSVVDKDLRQRVWSDVPLATAVGLLLYNTVLPELGTRGDGDSTPGLCLWMRNVVRYSPYERDELVGLVERQASRLSRGALWIGDLWPASSKGGSAGAFIAKLIGDALDVESFEAEAKDRISALLGCPGNTEESDVVLAVGRDGHLAAGFAEGKGKWKRAWVQDGAFQMVSTTQGSKVTPLLRVQKFAPVSLIEPWIGELTPAAQRGFRAMMRIG